MLRIPAALLAASTLLMGVLLVYGYRPDLWKSEGEIHFLDVGQGDSAWIHTPAGRNLLVDGGGTLTFGKEGEEWRIRKDPYEVGRKLLVPLLKKNGVHRLDALIISHEDADHIGGLQAVVEQIPVSRILFNGTLKPNAGVEKLFRTALDKNIPLLPVKNGLDWAADSDTTLHFLYPAPDRPEGVQTESEQNGWSVVFLMKMYGYSFLFTGDMEKSAEEDVLAQLNSPNLPAADGPHSQPNAQEGPLPSKSLLPAPPLPPGIDVLKVAHHGSKTSSTQEWLDFWRPKSAVISVGKNNLYRHPSPEVVERLRQSGSAVYRTDQRGEVRMKVSPAGISAETKLHEPAGD